MKNIRFPAFAALSLVLVSGLGALAATPTAAAIECATGVVYVECYGYCRVDVVHAGFVGRVHCAAVPVLQCEENDELVTCKILEEATKIELLN